MVIAGVVGEKKLWKELKKIGVKDSKILTPRKRTILCKKIENLVETTIVVRVQPCRIVYYKKKGINLDEVEAAKMAEIIKISKADIAYVDALGQNPRRFRSLLSSYLKDEKCKLVVGNHLDETNPFVAAASIVAKVNRDESIESLKKKVGFDFGVGYSHDERTREFIRRIMTREEEKPRYVRWHWSTIEDIANELVENRRKVKPWVRKEILGGIQKKIKDFFRKKKK